jgi:hypothetical protein
MHKLSFFFVAPSKIFFLSFIGQIKNRSYKFDVEKKVEDGSILFYDMGTFFFLSNSKIIFDWKVDKQLFLINYV